MYIGLERVTVPRFIPCRNAGRLVWYVVSQMVGLMDLLSYEMLGENNARGY